MEGTKKFEIIVKDGTSALRLVLPDHVADRIKELSELNSKDFEELNNEAIMKMMINSLDKLLYGFDHSSLHTKTDVNSEGGTATSEKSKDGTKETDSQ